MDYFDEVRLRMEANRKKIEEDGKAIEAAFNSLNVGPTSFVKFFWVYLGVGVLLSVATLGVVVWAIGLFAGKW